MATRFPSQEPSKIQGKPCPQRPRPALLLIFETKSHVGPGIGRRRREGGEAAGNRCSARHGARQNANAAASYGTKTFPGPVSPPGGVAFSFFSPLPHFCLPEKAFLAKAAFGQQPGSACRSGGDNTRRLWKRDQGSAPRLSWWGKATPHVKSRHRGAGPAEKGAGFSSQIIPVRKSNPSCEIQARGSRSCGKGTRIQLPDYPSEEKQPLM